MIFDDFKLQNYCTDKIEDDFAEYLYNPQYFIIEKSALEEENCAEQTCHKINDHLHMWIIKHDYSIYGEYSSSEDEYEWKEHAERSVFVFGYYQPFEQITILFDISVVR